MGGGGLSGRPRGIDMPHKDTDAPVREGLERVLVRDVVAQVERHHVVAVETQGL